MAQKQRYTRDVWENSHDNDYCLLGSRSNDEEDYPKWDELLALANSAAADRATVEAMRGALETFVEWFWGKEGESANDLFERIASEFKADTGYLRPGKDGGMVEQPSYEERSAAWNEWIKAKREAAEKLCREVLAAHPK